MNQTPNRMVMASHSRPYFAATVVLQGQCPCDGHLKKPRTCAAEKKSTGIISLDTALGYVVTRDNYKPIRLLESWPIQATTTGFVRLLL